MKYIVYLTTNLKSRVNNLNRIYVGVCKTNDDLIFDGYLGDGVYINQPHTFMYPKTSFQYDVKKYGTDSFFRIVLNVFTEKERALEKLKDILTDDFKNQSHVYNAYTDIKGINDVLYQFNDKGELMNTWESMLDACEFYSTSVYKFSHAIKSRRLVLGSFWNNEGTIDLTEYENKSWGEHQVCHLYNKDGKWLREFYDFQECADFLGIDKSEVVDSIKFNPLIKGKYYITNFITGLFVPSNRKKYYKSYFYVYDKNSLFMGKVRGKEIMPLIGEHSWKKINNIFEFQGGWYKDYYISLEEVDLVPEKKPYRVQVEVYDKYGKFIEVLGTIKDLREKYDVSAAKIKDMEQGNKFYKDWIFKYRKVFNDIV